MLKRSGFKRAEYVRPPRVLYVLARPLPAAQISEQSQPAPKERPARSAAYLRLVAALPCAACGVEGFSQAAHANLSKGLAIKSDDRTAFPACCDRPGVRGCHSLLDQGGQWDKAQRRALEVQWGASTRQAIVSRGLWPAGLDLLGS